MQQLASSLKLTTAFHGGGVIKIVTNALFNVFSKGRRVCVPKASLGGVPTVEAAVVVRSRLPQWSEAVVRLGPDQPGWQRLARGLSYNCRCCVQPSVAPYRGELCDVPLC